MSILPRNAVKTLLSIAASGGILLTQFSSPAWAGSFRIVPSHAINAFASYGRHRNYGQVTANPTSLAFGSVQVGSKKSLYGTVKNTGNSSVTISSASASGTGFSLTGLSMPLTLTSGQSVTFTVSFAPTASGGESGRVTFAYNRSQVTVSLSGTGTANGSLNASPTSINFGSVNVGATKSVSSTVTASGTSVTISSAGTNSSEFKLSGPTLPVTIAAGNSASFTITFEPQSSGAVSATASFVSNASNSPLSETLSGSGTAVTTSQQHSVNLSWSASTSSVAGYNIYRSTTPGSGYVKINASLDTATQYTDGIVQSGQTYYYVTTAVNSSGEESGYSNQVTAVIPTP